MFILHSLNGGTTPGRRRWGHHSTVDRPFARYSFGRHCGPASSIVRRLLSQFFRLLARSRLRSRATSLVHVYASNGIQAVCRYNSCLNSCGDSRARDLAVFWTRLSPWAGGRRRSRRAKPAVSHRGGRPSAQLERWSWGTEWDRSRLYLVMYSCTLG